MSGYAFLAWLLILRDGGNTDAMAIGMGCAAVVILIGLAVIFFRGQR